MENTVAGVQEAETDGLGSNQQEEPDPVGPTVAQINNCLRRSKNPLHRWGKWVGVDRGFHNQKDSIYLSVQGEKHPSRPKCVNSFRLKNSQQYSPHKPLLHTTT